MKPVLQLLLTVLAQAYIWRYRPLIVAITGNVGKTSTKEAIAAVLASPCRDSLSLRRRDRSLPLNAPSTSAAGRRIRSGKGNLNNEFGVPLTILGDWAEDYYEGGNTLWFWVRVLVVSFFGLFFQKNYPEVLVLEFGADKPGDIKRLTAKFKPHIGVVTAVGEVPVHVEYFSGPEAVAREKGRLVEALLISDFAVLNFDDLAVLEMKERTKAKIFTYGFGDGANIKISNFEFLTTARSRAVAFMAISNEKPEGVSFKMNYNDTLRGGGQGFVPFKLSGSLGKSQGYAAAAAAAVGVIFGMNLVDVSEALSEYHGPKSRLKILKGIKNSIIIDDSYNASPLSIHLALETLRDLPGARRVAVLGDMLELGKYTIKAHQDVGNLAGSFVDLLICVGSRAKFIADSAFNQMSKENIYRFDTSDEAKLKIKELIKEGDLILVKGSQGMRMEKIVEEIMAEPEKKKELLVRQSKKWLSK